MGRWHAGVATDPAVNYSTCSTRASHWIPTYIRCCLMAARTRSEWDIQDDALVRELGAMALL